MKIKFSSNLLPLSLLIRMWTMSRVSHVEFVFSDDTTIYPAVERGKIIKRETSKSYMNQYVYDLPFSVREEAIIRTWAEEQVGKPYDYTALAPFNVLIPRRKKGMQDQSRWMCSEFCTHGLSLIGMDLFEQGMKKITPHDLFSRFNTNYEFVPLGETQ